MRSALIAAVSCVLALPAAAQQQAAPPVQIPPEIVALKQYVNTPDYVATSARIALEGDLDLAPECKAAKTEARVGFVIMHKPVFQDGNPHPVAGQWKDQIKIDRCGTPVIHNIIVTARPGALPEIGLALPGETALSPRLQAQILPEVLKAGAAKLKCKEANKAVITNTELDKVIQQPKANAQGLVVDGKWQETWTVRACGKTKPVVLELASDGKGGAVHKVK